MRGFATRMRIATKGSAKDSHLLPMENASAIRDGTETFAMTRIAMEIATMVNVTMTNVIVTPAGREIIATLKSSTRSRSLPRRSAPRHEHKVDAPMTSKASLTI